MYWAREELFFCLQVKVGGPLDLYSSSNPTQVFFFSNLFTLVFYFQSECVVSPFHHKHLLLVTVYIQRVVGETPFFLTIL